jgi:hypothetical protein
MFKQEKNSMQTVNLWKRGRWLAVGLALSAVWGGLAQDSPPDRSAAFAASPAPPPSAPAKRSAADLEKLVAPIALYPDPLLATVLPASVYPLEIVQAARFVADPKNIANIDEQPWDQNVKDLARVPDALKKFNEDLNWTIELGEAFLAQDKDVMDAIQNMRAKAQKAGTLQTTAQQIVIVTNMVVEKTIEHQVVVVTNTIVEIAPASTTTVYVPTYNPYTVYYPPPAYVYNPMAPLVTFGVGMAWGAILANNCDWHHGGCYNNNININNNYNRNNVNNINRNGNNNRAGTTGQKWQPDQNRLNKSGATSTGSRDARGWSGGAQAGQRPATGNVGARPSTGNVGARPSTGNVGARPSTGNVGARPTTGNTAARPSTQPSGARPTSNFQQPTGSRPSGGGVTQPSVRQPSVQQPSVRQPSANRSGTSPAANNRSSSGSSAFGGVSSGSSARSFSSRGAASRGGGGGARSGGGGGGGRR